MFHRVKFLLFVALALAIFAVPSCGKSLPETPDTKGIEPKASPSPISSIDEDEPPVGEHEGEKSIEPLETGVPVVGWLGYVLSTSFGDQFDDYVVLDPEGTGEFGIEGADETIELKIVELQDKEEPGKYAHFWGKLMCEVIDYGGCQLLVTRVRSGIEITNPEPVEELEGKIYSFEFGMQFDDYFILEGEFPIRFGIESMFGEDGMPLFDDEIENLRDTKRVVIISGQLTCGIPDAYGCQILVSNIKAK